MSTESVRTKALPPKVEGFTPPPCGARQVARRAGSRGGQGRAWPANLGARRRRTARARPGAGAAARCRCRAAPPGTAPARLQPAWRATNQDASVHAGTRHGARPGSLTRACRARPSIQRMFHARPRSSTVPPCLVLDQRRRLGAPLRPRGRPGAPGPARARRRAQRRQSPRPPPRARAPRCLRARQAPPQPARASESVCSPRGCQRYLQCWQAAECASCRAAVGQYGLD